MRRVYCWRVGIVLELGEDERCPECGSKDHELYLADNCGNFVPNLSGRGNPCQLPIDHVGYCSINPEKIVERIHEQ